MTNMHEYESMPAPSDSNPERQVIMYKKGSKYNTPTLHQCIKKYDYLCFFFLLQQ